MTGLVRGLLAAPVAALVGWLASVGVHVSSDLVVSVITAAVGAVAMAGLHWAEGRCPAVRAVVAWLGREVPVVAGAITAGPPGTGPAGPSNVRRVAPTATGGGHPTGPFPPEPATGPQTPSGASGVTSTPADQPPGTQ